MLCSIKDDIVHLIIFPIINFLQFQRKHFFMQYPAQADGKSFLYVLSSVKHNMQLL